MNLAMTNTNTQADFANKPLDKHVHWTELLYNPYRKGLFPGLLHSETGVVKISFYGRCKGMKTKDDEIKMLVTYDTDYLLEYMIKKIIIPLHVTDGKKFNKLMASLGKAYKRHKSQIGNEDS
jgi:hypothetical protein